MLEDRVALLSKLTTTVAGLTAQNGQERCCDSESIYTKNIPESDEEDEPESEPESDTESDVDCEVVCNANNQVIEREFPILKNILLSQCCMPVCDLNPVTVELSDVGVLEPLSVPIITEVLSEVLSESLDVDVNLPKRKISEDNVKTLQVNVDYDSMSVKELKERVADLGGPKLKTKKDLVEFLKNKI